MPIRKMMAAHPAAKGHINEPLAEAARKALDCSITCTACADACTGETMMMPQCVRSCLDCADICIATARLAVRQTGANDVALRAILRACIEACEACAAECEGHDNPHCRLCATVCRECADDCREALAMLG
jgi:hypothetical protein